MLSAADTVVVEFDLLGTHLGSLTGEEPTGQVLPVPDGGAVRVRARGRRHRVRARLLRLRDHLRPAARRRLSRAAARLPACAVSAGPTRISSTRARCDGGVAPGRRERPGPLHPQMQVVLPRVADGPVDLERGARRAGWRRPTPWPWPSRQCRPASGSPADKRPRGPVDHRPGELHPHQRVGEVVLHGLEGPDGLAELRPLVGVLRGHGDRAGRPPRPTPPRCPSPPGRPVSGEDLLGFEPRHHERRRGRLPLDLRQPPRRRRARAAA